MSRWYGLSQTDLPSDQSLLTKFKTLILKRIHAAREHAASAYKLSLKPLYAWNAQFRVGFEHIAAV
jgi:hypothetical protein